MPHRRLCIAAGLLLGSVSVAQAADFFCNNLVPSGSKMICPGFEPNWAVEFVCSGTVMRSNFIDAFSGSEITTTPGSVTFLSQDPWQFDTTHGVGGVVASTPGACQDESSRFFDYTLTTTSVPGFSGPVPSICCRIQ